MKRESQLPIRFRLFLRLLEAVRSSGIECLSRSLESMEVAGLNFDSIDVERCNASGFDVDDAVIVLQLTLDT